MAQDPRKFIVSSDYPMDFIIWNSEGEVTSQNLSPTTYTIAHGLPYTPLVFGQFSLDNGNSWLPLGINDFFTNKIDIYSESDNTNVYIHFTYLQSGTKTAKFRVWAFAPANASGIIQTPQQSSNVFHLDTDFNYSKLVHAGEWTIETGDRKTIYQHGLGYIPEVMAWLETNTGKISDARPVFSDHPEYWPEQYVQINNNNLYAKFSSANQGTTGTTIYTKVHYRIYGGENG